MKYRSNSEPVTFPTQIKSNIISKVNWKTGNANHFVDKTVEPLYQTKETSCMTSSSLLPSLAKTRCKASLPNTRLFRDQGSS